VLLAYALGFEVEAKIGRGVNPHHYNLGWHATSTLGTLGAAAACAKLLSLDVPQTQTALGIAASTAAGLRQNFGTMTKPLHPGQAAMNGVNAALLAQLGWTAERDILEAPYGFCQLYAGAGHYNLDNIVKQLGNPYELIATGVAIKWHVGPCAAAQAERRRCGRRGMPGRTPNHRSPDSLPPPNRLRGQVQHAILPGGGAPGPPHRLAVVLG
jgi:2-methylcitrate dehydratase PrpD